MKTKKKIIGGKAITDRSTLLTQSINKVIEDWLTANEHDMHPADLFGCVMGATARLSAAHIVGFGDPEGIDMFQNLFKRSIVDSAKDFEK